MIHIVVSDDQAQIISGSAAQIEIRDRNGNHLGYVAHGFSAADIALARQRAASPQPRLDIKQVLNHLQSLEPQ
jgi:hypothetical protein